MQIKIKKLKEDAVLPSYAYPGDVGLDIYSLEDKILAPGERHIFFLGFALEFDNGYAAIVKDKSSLPGKHGIHTMGGVFDAGYRGEYSAQLINLSHETVEIVKRQKIAQLIIFPVAIANLVEVSELSESQRGEGKMGSSGKF